ncbi:unnamed protein product [Coregonus sp. 'balchen']|nr:unnamed protein product [Coregonus sp. 'balchen']
MSAVANVRLHSVGNLQVEHGDFYSLLSKLLGESEGVVHVHKYTPGEAQSAQAKLVAQIDSIMQKKDLGWPSPRLDFLDREDSILVRDRVHKFHQLEATARPPGSKLMPANANALVQIDDDEEADHRFLAFLCVCVCVCVCVGYHLEEVTDWPESPLQLGQVSGLALDSDDNLVIFHRGDHRWGVK